jgi:DNA-binding ferritin-like protein
MQIEIIRTNTPFDPTVNFGIILNKVISNIKMLHWYTGCYNMHLIFGELYESLSDLFDKLQEEIIGTSKKTGIEFPNISLTVDEPNSITYTDDEYITSEYYDIDNKLKEILYSLEFKGYTDSVKSGIENTKDEITTAFNKATYLLSLIKK